MLTGTTIMYRPVMKTKAAEFGALAELKPEVRARLTPLFDVQPPPREWEGGRKPLATHLESVLARLEKVADAGVVLLDLPFVEAGTRATDGTHPARGVFMRALDLGVQLVPVSGIRRDGAYDEAVLVAAKASGRGVAVRLNDQDLNPLLLGRNLKRLLDRVGATPEESDLIVDLQQVSTNDVATRSVGLHTILTQLPAVAAWRSFTLIGGAFPMNLVGLKANHIRKISRAEWLLWQRVRESLAMPIDYGDYIVDNPTPFDRDPKTVQASANIRYAADEQWIVVKGRGTKKNGWGQTLALSAQLVKQQEFKGEAFSAGDAYIAKRARGEVSSGNSTVWRRVAIVHHLTQVTTQLAKLGEL
jgi:hypothetical protein